MEKWAEFKKSIHSLDEEEKNKIDEVASFVAEIVQRRLDLGLTQRQLAEISGVKQSAIARIENNGVIPRIDTLYKLLIPLGLSLKLINKEDS